MRGTSLSLSVEGESTSRSQEKSSLVFGLALPSNVMLDNTAALTLKSEASLFLAYGRVGAIALCREKDYRKTP
jgi:hypothetical protein